MNRKGAIELSIGTIVIIVLAMCVLILGLVWLRGLFADNPSGDQVCAKLLENDPDKVFPQNPQLYEQMEWMKDAWKAKDVQIIESTASAYNDEVAVCKIHYYVCQEINNAQNQTLRSCLDVYSDFEISMKGGEQDG